MTEPVILNLGCGTRTSLACVNIDWSIHLRLKRWHLERLAGRDRRESIAAVDGAVVVHDLGRGIPAADSTVDAVYHSHLLEHIPRDAVPALLCEIHRVLKPGGIQRIVVPDFELLARRYLERFGEPGHEERISAMIEQIARGEAYGTSRQRPLRRRIERLMLGDARRRGEAHRWMYDRVNLTELLEATGFAEVKVVSHDVSDIEGWNPAELDALPDGRPYKPDSLYVEARAGSERAVPS